MCTVFVAYKVVRDHPLIVAANRDEFYDRPSQPMAFWQDEPHVLAGRDMLAQGTWLGLNRNGRFAVTTNYREPQSEKENFRSRGQLPAAFLTDQPDIEAFATQLKTARDAYRGYNLIFGSIHEGLHYFSNRDGHRKTLEPGIYGLSNHFLNTPWPKVEIGMNAFEGWGENPDQWHTEKLFQLLSNREQAPDDQLPDTGVGLGWERLLSATFIETFTYGTRNSTVIRFHEDQSVHVEEWHFTKPGDEAHKQTFQFTWQA